MANDPEPAREITPVFERDDDAAMVGVIGLALARSTRQPGTDARTPWDYATAGDFARVLWPEIKRAMRGG